MFSASAQIFLFAGLGVLGIASLSIGIVEPTKAPLTEVVAVLPISGADTRDGNDALRSILLAAVTSRSKAGSGARVTSININNLKKSDLVLAELTHRGSGASRPTLIAHVTSDELSALQFSTVLIDRFDRILTPSATATEFAAKERGSPHSALRVEQFCPDNRALAEAMYARLEESDATDGDDCPHIIADPNTTSKYITDLAGQFTAQKPGRNTEKLVRTIAPDTNTEALYSCYGAVFLGGPDEFMRFLSTTARSPAKPKDGKFTLVVADAASSKNLFNNEATTPDFEALHTAGWDVLFTTLYSEDILQTRHRKFSVDYDAHYKAPPSLSSFWVYQTALAAFGAASVRHINGQGVAILTWQQAANIAKLGTLGSAENAAKSP